MSHEMKSFYEQVILALEQLYISPWLASSAAWEAHTVLHIDDGSKVQ